MRNPAIDISKGIGIILVVLGHNPIIFLDNPELCRMIFSCHMPLFFFIAGLLFNHEKCYTAIIYEKFQRLLVPYLMVLAVVGIPKFIWHDFSPIKYFLGIFYAGGNVIAYDFDWVALWFLPHLFLLYLVWTAFLKVIAGRKAILLFLMIVCVVLGPPVLRYFADKLLFSGGAANIIGVRGMIVGLPYGLDIFLISSLYFLLGYIVRPRFNGFGFHASHFLLAFAMFFALHYFYDESMNLHLRYYGNSFIVTLEAISGIYLILMAASFMRKNNYLDVVFSYLGSISIWILLFHLFFQENIRLFLEKWYPAMIFESRVIAFVSGLVFPVLIVEVSRRWLFPMWENLSIKSKAIRFNYSDQFNKWIIVAAASGFIAALAIFIYRVVQGMTLFEMPDETEKFVAAQMINHGMSLYGDIFAHHGPLVYMLAHAYSVFVSSIDFSYVRSITALFAMLSAVAVFFTPLLKNSATRFLAASLYLSLVSSVWIVHGMQFMLYHSLGGFLFVIAISQLLLPAFFGILPGKWSTFFSGFAIGLTCFAAYSYGPAAVLFTFMALFILFKKTAENDKLYFLYYFFGLFFSSLVVLLWLLSYGDIKGYFIYHFYFNQAIYSKYLEFNAYNFLDNALISRLPEMKIQSLAFAFSLFAMLSIAANKLKKDLLINVFLLISLLTLLLFVFLLNPRGEYIFKDGAFVLASFCLYALSLCCWLEKYLDKNCYFWAFIIFISVVFSAVFAENVAKKSLSSPDRIPRKDYLLYPTAPKPANDSENDFIRYIAKSDERILVLVYDPKVYIHANRLPAIGHYYYFPWQAAYQRAPIGGHQIDFCRALEHAKPPLIIFDDWKVWYSFSMPQYEPCITDFLNKFYVQLPYVGKFYIRRDRAEKYNLPTEISGLKMNPSAEVAKDNPIRLYFDRSVRQHDDLVKIEIRFGTYNRINLGKAELLLRSSDGNEFRQNITLPELADNHYFAVDVPPRNYVSGEIRWLSGGGVSTWETNSIDQSIATCLIFDYRNGDRHFTMGCPLF